MRAADFLIGKPARQHSRSEVRKLRADRMQFLEGCSRSAYNAEGWAEKKSGLALFLQNFASGHGCATPCSIPATMARIAKNVDALEIALL